MNNNGVIDSLEDDFEPQYEYGIDRKGYHIVASYDLLDNLTLKVGWLNESEISSRRQNNSKYMHLIYQRDIPDFGTMLFQNRFVRVRDDIPEYSITLRPGELDANQESDELDFLQCACEYIDTPVHLHSNPEFDGRNEVLVSSSKTV